MDGVTLVIPCYNESHRLDTTALLAFASQQPGVRFLLVNDGSTDGTLAQLSALEKARPESFATLDLRFNRGKGEAVRQGVLSALRSEPRYVGYWDADLSTPLSALTDLYQVLEERPEIQMAVGSRVQLLGRRIQRRAARHYLGRVFATLVSLLLGLRVYDTQCGAKLLRVGGGTEDLFTSPFLSRWVFDVEIFARFLRARHRNDTTLVEQAICELPLTEWRDVAGSKLRPVDWARALTDLVVIYWRVVRGPAAPTAIDEPLPRSRNGVAR